MAAGAGAPTGGVAAPTGGVGAAGVGAAPAGGVGTSGVGAAPTGAAPTGWAWVCDLAALWLATCLAQPSKIMRTPLSSGLGGLVSESGGGKGRELL